MPKLVRHLKKPMTSEPLKQVQGDRFFCETVDSEFRITLFEWGNLSGCFPIFVFFHLQFALVRCVSTLLGWFSIFHFAFFILQFSLICWRGFRARILQMVDLRLVDGCSGDCCPGHHSCGEIWRGKENRDRWRQSLFHHRILLLAHPDHCLHHLGPYPGLLTSGRVLGYRYSAYSFTAFRFF